MNKSTITFQELWSLIGELQAINIRENKAIFCLDIFHSSIDLEYFEDGYKMSAIKSLREPTDKVSIDAKDELDITRGYYTIKLWLGYMSNKKSDAMTHRL
jgi:hypothetical protein